MADVTPSSPDSPLASGTTDWINSAAASSSGTPTDDEMHDTSKMGGTTSYFIAFVVLGLLVICAFILFNWHRKRELERLRNAGLQDHNATTVPWEAFDADERDSAIRHSRFGYRRSNQYAREEGLNERGEAPPPYVPPPREEEIRAEMPAVPLRTLSRDQAGLKPPEYRP